MLTPTVQHQADMQRGTGGDEAAAGESVWDRFEEKPTGNRLGDATTGDRFDEKPTGDWLGERAAGNRLDEKPAENRLDETPAAGDRREGKPTGDWLEENTSGEWLGTRNKEGRNRLEDEPTAPVSGTPSSESQLLEWTERPAEGDALPVVSEGPGGAVDTDAVDAADGTGIPATVIPTSTADDAHTPATPAVEDERRGGVDGGGGGGGADDWRSGRLDVAKPPSLRGAGRLGEADDAAAADALSQGLRHVGAAGAAAVATAGVGAGADGDALAPAVAVNDAGGDHEQLVQQNKMLNEIVKQELVEGSVKERALLKKMMDSVTALQEDLDQARVSVGDVLHLPGCW